MNAHFRLCIAFLTAVAFLGIAPSARADGPCKAQYDVTKTVDTNDGNCSTSDCSLREAVQAANACSGSHLIVLPAGTFLIGRPDGNPDAHDDTGATGDLDIHGSVSIQGAGAAQTFIDGQTIHRIFDVHPVLALTFRLQNLTLYRGAALHAGNTYHGGGALRLARGDTAYLNHVSIKQSYADHDNGAAAISSEGRLYVDDSVFEDNISLSGISLMMNGVFAETFLLDTVVRNNWSLGRYTIRNYGSIEVSTSTFSNNIVSGTGTGISAIENRNRLVIDRSLFEDNRGGMLGAVAGALSSSQTSVTQSTFRRNRAEGPASEGGAIYSNGSTTIARSLFDANSAGAAGGAIRVAGPTSITESVIRYSTAGERGGGIAVFGSETLIDKAYIGENSAGRGGGIYSSSTKTRVVNTTIHGNRATAASGGGVYAAQGRMDLKNATVTDNNTGNRTAVVMDALAQLNLAHTLVFNSSGVGYECGGTGVATSYGFNRSADGACDMDGPGDARLTNPLLGYVVASSLMTGSPSAQMGLPIRQPLTGSPLINRGSVGVDPTNDATRGGCTAYDAIRTARPVNSACDIGAVESTLPR